MTSTFACRYNGANLMLHEVSFEDDDLFDVIDDEITENSDIASMNADFYTCCTTIVLVYILYKLGMLKFYHKFIGYFQHTKHRIFSY